MSGEDSAESVVHQLWAELGIDPATKRAVSPDPPRDPPGPIAVCIEPSWSMYDEFVERVATIVGRNLVVVDENDPSALPPDCFGAICLEMWLLQLACVGRGLEVHMFETWRSFELEDMEDRSWPGYKLIGFQQDWRPLVDRAAEELVGARHRASQSYVAKMMGPGDFGTPTVWSQRIAGASGATYSFERVIGLGGTAIVALVRNPSGEPYAAKALSAHRLPIEGREDRFVREGRILSELDHPNVLKVVDLATMDEGTPVLVFEYLPGGSIYQHLAAQGRPELATSMRWLREALLGLSALHEARVVHRDISAKNLLLGASGEVIVGDFGTARHLDDATLTASADRIGSLVYMAPEQFRGAHDVDLTADVYSIGQVGFQLLTGSMPLGNTGSAKSRNPDVPSAVSDLIDAFRSYEPVDRPVNATEALGLLDMSWDR